MSKKVEISKKRYKELLKAEKKVDKLKRELGELSYILNEVGAGLGYRGCRVGVSSSNERVKITVCLETMDGSPREINRIVEKSANEITPYDLLFATFDAMMYQMFGKGDDVEKTVAAIDTFANTVASEIQKNSAAEKKDGCDCCKSCCGKCEEDDIFSYGLGIDYLSETDELEVTFPDDSAITSPLLSHTREGIYAALFSAVAFYLTDDLTTQYISDAADEFYKKMAGEESPKTLETEEPVDKTPEPKAEASEESAVCDSETTDDIIA